MLIKSLVTFIKELGGKTYEILTGPDDRPEELMGDVIEPQDEREIIVKERNIDISEKLTSVEVEK